MAAQWQQELDVTFDAVLLCGDVGTFTDESQLDSATQSRARSNPCELEFLYQWSVDPQPPWIAKIFASIEHDGLGLEAPVLMVHGNHEGFRHLQERVPSEIPEQAVAATDLPPVDSEGWIRYLPSGWKCLTRSGITVAGIGGIEREQRRAAYHDLAYIDERAVELLWDSEPVDVLVTHQGPASIQGDEGSETLDFLLDPELADIWFHGHATPNREITQWGPDEGTTVVPLGNAAFSMNSPYGPDPGIDAWCWVRLDDQIRIERARPGFWRDYRMSRWEERPSGQLVAPPLA